VQPSLSESIDPVQYALVGIDSQDSVSLLVLPQQAVRVRAKALRSSQEVRVKVLREVLADGC